MPGTNTPPLKSKCDKWSARVECSLTGYYHVNMCGASGGGSYGGKGAGINGTVHLKEGTKLIVLVSC